MSGFTSNPSNRPAAIGLRLYRALANAFPQEFKNAYGLELLQVSEDAIEPIWRCYGMPGPASVLRGIWIRVGDEHGAERAERNGRFGVVAIVACQEFQWVISARNRSKTPGVVSLEFFRRSGGSGKSVGSYLDLGARREIKN